MNCVICKNYGDCPVEKDIAGRIWKLESNGLNGIECAEYKPDYITPEQWEKRTGRAWTDNAAVYFRISRADCWVITSFENAKRDVIIHLIPAADIICATEAGGPPDNWRPK